MVKRLCVVGAGGQIGSVHLEALLQLRDAHLLGDYGVAICSSNEQVRSGDLSACGNNLGVTVRDRFDPRREDVLVFETYEDALESWEVAGVILATPSQAHVAQALEAIAADKAVLIEKPVALDVDGVVKILQRIEELDAVDCPPCVGVGQVLPYFQAYRALSQSLAWAKTGGEEPVSASFKRTLSGDHSFCQPTKAQEIGSPWIDLAVHDINLMWHFFGEPRSHQVISDAVRIAAADASYLLRCKAVFSYDWGEVAVDAGIDELQEAPFAHAFCVEMPDSDAFVMSSTETSWQARCRSTQLPLLLPPGLRGVSDDVMPFALELRDFIAGMGNQGMAKYLCPYAAGNAVQLACMVQDTALAAVQAN